MLNTDPPPDTVVVCVHEQGPIQWIPHPGRGRRSEQNPLQLPAHHARPGSSKHLAALCPHTGEVPGSNLELRVRGQEFAAFMEATLRGLDAQHPEKRFALVMDNQQVHKTELVQSKLRSYGDRVPVCYAPTSPSWLNRIESFMGKVRDDYSRARPHGSPDKVGPEEFVQQALGAQLDGRRESSNGTARGSQRQ